MSVNNTVRRARCDCAGAAWVPVRNSSIPVKIRVGLGDQPGPVGAVSTFLADTGANIVSLDQHSTQHWRLDRTDGNIHLAVAPVPHVLRTKLGHILTGLGDEAREHTGGTFMQRTIFHLPGLAAARDASKRDFAEQVAAPSASIFTSRRPPSPSGRHHGVDRGTTAYSICCGATVAASWTCRWLW